MFPPFLGIETAASAGPRRCRCKEKGEAAELRSLHFFRWVDHSVVPADEPGKKKNGSRGFRCFPSSLIFLQIHHIMRARFDTSTMWVRSGYASGAISRIQDNTGCRCFASVHLVSIRYLFGVLLVYNRCSSGVRLVCSRCDGVLQSRKKHDPQDSESRRSHFYVYSISWVNTDMQLTSY